MGKAKPTITTSTKTTTKTVVDAPGLFVIIFQVDTSEDGSTSWHIEARAKSKGRTKVSKFEKQVAALHNPAKGWSTGRTTAAWSFHGPGWTDAHQALIDAAVVLAS